MQTVLAIKTVSLEEGKKLCIKRKEITYLLSRVILATNTETYKHTRKSEPEGSLKYCLLYTYMTECIKNEETVD